MVDVVPKPPHPFLVSIAVSLAAFMEVLDTTIANVALSHIAGSLGTSSEESTWVLTSYLVSNGIVLPLSGWLSALMGRKNFFVLCILGFTFTSFLCGISTSLSMLIVFRLFQGLAGGGLQPSQQAIIKDSFPPEKVGMAFAITGITTVVAPIIGPVLGGYITDNFSWRWIFFINVPIGLLAACFVKVLVQDPPSAQKQKVDSIDYIGLSLIAISLGALQIVLDKGQQEDWFDSSFIIILTCVAVVGLSLAIFWLLRQRHPVVELRLFSIPSFGMSCMMIFFVGFSLLASTMLLPMQVQENFGYDVILSGLVLAPGGIAILVMLPVTGKLVNIIQAKYLISLGMLISAIGMWAGGLITPQTDYNTFVFVRILQTVGIPFLFVPANTLAFSKISPENSSNASALMVLMKNLGGSMGISLITNKLIHSQQIEQSYLVQHLTMGDIGYHSTITTYIQMIANLGLPSFLTNNAISTAALAKIYQELVKQASILAYRDIFNFMGGMLLILAIVALFMPNNNGNFISKTNKRTQKAQSCGIE